MIAQFCSLCILHLGLCVPTTLPDSNHKTRGLKLEASTTLACHNVKHIYQYIYCACSLFIKGRPGDIVISVLSAHLLSLLLSRATDLQEPRAEHDWCNAGHLKGLGVERSSQDRKQLLSGTYQGNLLSQQAHGMNEEDKLGG